jgi:inhibitor of KinA
LPQVFVLSTINTSGSYKISVIFIYMDENESFVFQLYSLGDTAIVVQFGNVIAPDINRKVIAYAACLENSSFPGLVEWVPAFTSLTIYYDPWVVSEKGAYDPYGKMVDFIHEIASHGEIDEAKPTRLVEIPVYYGEEFGPDLEFVAKHTNLTTEEVIAVHSSEEYLVYMIGFAPGFPYLGGMSKKIAAPRRKTPRLVIPAGSVGIAGTQTGVYPIETPGGWQLIGRTPLSLFYPYRESPSLLQAGDTVRFVPITRGEYFALEGGRE